MKLGIANRVCVFDADLADTQEVTPLYSDVVVLYTENDPLLDSLADAWLANMGVE